MNSWPTHHFGVYWSESGRANICGYDDSDAFVTWIDDEMEKFRKSEKRLVLILRRTLREIRQGCEYVREMMRLYVCRMLFYEEIRSIYRQQKYVGGVCY